jgi:hypothetical protein
LQAPATPENSFSFASALVCLTPEASYHSNYSKKPPTIVNLWPSPSTHQQPSYKPAPQSHHKHHINKNNMQYNPTMTNHICNIKFNLHSEHNL